MTGKRFAMVPVRAAESRDLSANDLRVLIAIAAHANGTGSAHPSLGRLASITGIARRHVVRSITRLVSARHLRKRRRRDDRGGWDRSAYEVILDGPDVTASSDMGVPPRGNRGVPSDESSLFPPEGTGVFPEMGKGCSLKWDTEQTTRTDQRLPPPPQEVLPAVEGTFETFWQAYPSRSPHPNPKKPARLKFDAAVKGGADPSAITAGARRYAGYILRTGKRPEFVAMASTWLNQERWTEDHREPHPAPRAGMI